MPVRASIDAAASSAEAAQKPLALRASEAEPSPSAAVSRRSTFNYETARDHFLAAADLLEGDDPEAAFWRITDAAEALRESGERFGDPAHLREAAALVNTRALPLVPQDTNPTRWADGQIFIGNALRVLGERGDDDALMTGAVTAYRDALTVYTREAAPMDWAMTQNNLGTALQGPRRTRG